MENAFAAVRVPAGLDEASLKLAAHKMQAQTAAELIEKASASGSNRVEHHYSLGLAFYQLHNYADAVHHLTTSYMLDKTADTAARIALAAWRGGDIEVAETWARTAVGTEPKGVLSPLTIGTKPSYQAILAQVQLSAGKFAAARESAEGALALGDEDLAAATVLAVVQMVEGDAQAGLETLSRARDAAPDALAAQFEIVAGSLETIAAAGTQLKPFAVELEDLLRNVA